MSKTLTRNTHWLPKTGSHSVRLNRSGDIGSALPAGAKDAAPFPLAGVTRLVEAIGRIGDDRWEA